MWVRFRVSMVMDLLTMVAQASLFFFVGQALGSGGQSSTSNYAAFLTVGLVFSAFLDASSNAPYQSLAGNYWSARLESVLASPCPVWTVVLADSAVGLRAGGDQRRDAGNRGLGVGARISATPGELGLALVALMCWRSQRSWGLG